MFAYRTIVLTMAGIAGKRAIAVFCQALALAGLVAVGWSLAAAQALGQESSFAAGRQTSVETPPGAVADAPPAAVPSAWGPSLDWSPHKPSLPVEPDFFVNVDLALVFPHLNSHLIAPVALGHSGLTRLVDLRNAPLNITMSPFIQLTAFRLEPGYGQISVSYRLLAADGSDLQPAFDPAGAALAAVRTRLNLQTFDVDYIRDDCHLGWGTVLSWHVGARLEIVFFDTSAQTAVSFEHASNYCFAAGAHAGFTVSRELSDGFGLFGRFDGALLGAYNTNQNFAATIQTPQNGALSGTANQEQSQFSPSLAVQVGVSWVPTWLPSSRVRAGYQFDQWYNIGRADASRGNLNAHSLFAGWEWYF
jgi:hypothetical protein